MCRGVKTVAVSDGFCDLFGYTDREQAYADMNLNMFKNVHPEDTAGFTHALLRFGTEGGRIELLYRNKRSDGTGYRVIRLVGEHVSEGNGVELAHLWFADEGDYHDTSAQTDWRLIACGRNNSGTRSVVWRSRSLSAAFRSRRARPHRPRRPWQTRRPLSAKAWTRPLRS
jgi:PAS domain-containing protein